MELKLSQDLYTYSSTAESSYLILPQIPESYHGRPFRTNSNPLLACRGSTRDATRSSEPAQWAHVLDASLETSETRVSLLGHCPLHGY